MRGNLTDNRTPADIAVQKLQREARVWASLKAPNIVPLLGTALDMTKGGVPSLVSPFYQNGNLKSYMKSNRSRLSPLKMLDMVDLLGFHHIILVSHYTLGLSICKRAPIFAQLQSSPWGSEACKYFSAFPCNDLEHLSYFQDNILVDDKGEVVIADFGLSCILETAGFTTRNFYGSIRYTAPELLLDSGQPIRKTQEADVWAFAITSTEVL